MSDVQDKVTRPVEPALGTATSPAGTGLRDQYRWNQDHSGIVKIGTVNQKEMIDAASKGMTPGEQIARILRGDLSVYLPGEGVTGDVTGNAERTSAQVLHEAIKPIQQATFVAQENGKSLQELEKELAAMQAKVEEMKKKENKTEEIENA